MMYSIIFLLLFLIFFELNNIVFKKKNNFLNIFWVFFFAVILLSEINIYSFREVKPIVYIYLTISIVFIEIDSLLLYKLKIRSKFIKNNEDKENNKILNNKMLTILSIVTLLMMLPQTFTGLKIIKTQGFSMLRTLILTEELFKGNIRLLQYYLLSPLSKAIALYSIFDLVKNKKFRLHFLFSMINIVQISLLSAGRSSVFEFLIFAIIIMMEVYNMKILKLVKNNKKIVFACVLLVLFLMGVTSQRKLSSNTNFFENIYAYFVGSLSLISIHLGNVEQSLLDGSHLLFGKGMLSPFFDIFKIFIKFIGIDTNMKTGVQIINEVTQNFYYVSSNIKMNNNVTFLYTCLRDFGIFGLYIGPLYISLIYTKFAKMYEKYQKDCYKIAYYYLLSLIPYFIFFFPFANTPTFMLFVLIFLVYKITYKKEGNGDVK